MTDRELLEKAAKAAGIRLGEWREHEGYRLIDRSVETYWDALSSDGDALRLAMKLGMELCLWPTSVTAKVGSICFAQVPAGDHRAAATRRAIVEAAAQRLHGASGSPSGEGAEPDGQ